MNTKLKCPKCGHQESVLSSRPSAQEPPCPRCPTFIRMVPVPPDNTSYGTDGKSVWSSGGQPK